MSEMKRTWIEGVEYSYDANEEYEKDGHVYCKTCHERKDGKILEFFGGKMICRVSCHCDKQREEKEAKRQKQLENVSRVVVLVPELNGSTALRIIKEKKIKVFLLPRTL